MNLRAQNVVGAPNGLAPVRPRPPSSKTRSYPCQLKQRCRGLCGGGPMELPGRSYLSRCRTSTSGRTRRRGSRHTQSKQHEQLSSAPKHRHATSRTRAAPPLCDRPKGTFQLSLRSGSPDPGRKCTAYFFSALSGHGGAHCRKRSWRTSSRGIPHGQRQIALSPRLGTPYR